MANQGNPMHAALSGAGDALAKMIMAKRQKAKTAAAAAGSPAPAPMAAPPPAPPPAPHEEDGYDPLARLFAARDPEKKQLPPPQARMYGSKPKAPAAPMSPGKPPMLKPKPFGK